MYQYKKSIYKLLALGFIFIFLDFIIPGFKYLAYCSVFAIWFLVFPRPSYKSSQHNIFAILVTYFIFLIFRGLVLNNFDRYLYFDIFIFSSVIFIYYFDSNISITEYRTKIPELFAKLLIIGVPFSIISFFLFGSQDILNTYTRTFISEDSAINEKAIIQPILMAPLLVPFIFSLKRHLRYLIIIANLLVLFYGIFTATRVLVTIPLLAMVSLLFQQKHFFSSSKLLIGLIVCILSISYLFSDQFQLTFLSKLDYSVSRFENQDNFTSYRNTEVEGLFNNFSTTEFVFGRGAGAEQKFGFWENLLPGQRGPQLCHFGFLHLILKGGFILLFLIYGLAFYSLFVLFNKNERQYFFVILMYLTYEISHTKFLDYFYVLFLWLSISYALRISKMSKKQYNILTS